MVVLTLPPGTIGWALAQGIRCRLQKPLVCMLPTQPYNSVGCPRMDTHCLLWVAGYDASPGFHPSHAFAIHHPGGNAKRISFVNDTCAREDVPVMTACVHISDAVEPML